MTALGTRSWNSWSRSTGAGPEDWEPPEQSSSSRRHGGRFASWSLIFSVVLALSGSDLGILAQTQVVPVRQGGEVAATILETPPWAETVPASAGRRPSTRIAQSYGELPLRFEPYLSQSSGPARFVSRGGGYTLFLTNDGAVLALQRPGAGSQESKGSERVQPPTRAVGAPAVLRMNLAGANPQANIEGTDELPGKSNYFIGNDPAKWHTNVPNYAKVRYRGNSLSTDLDVLRRWWRRQWIRPQREWDACGNLLDYGKRSFRPGEPQRGGYCRCPVSAARPRLRASADLAA